MSLPPPRAGDAKARALVGRVYAYGLSPAQRILRDQVVAAGWSLRDRLVAVNHLAYRGAHPTDVRAVRQWLFAVHEVPVRSR